MRRAAVLLAGVLVAGCAPEVLRVPIQPVAQAPGGRAATIAVRQPAVLNLGTGYPRTLAAGSRWRLAGALPQGLVYQAAQGVFTVEGANIHEAYLVLRGREVVGFYLPAEQAYSPLKDAVMLVLED